jgi:sugar phosphate isomerase/epimerase
MHRRISIHQVSLPGLTLTQFVQQARDLAVSRVSFMSPPLLAEGGLDEARAALGPGDVAAETIAHPFLAAGDLSQGAPILQAARDRLMRLIDHAAALKARSIYMLTGGRGSLNWQQAADVFEKSMAPCNAYAQSAGIRLAIENAPSLYADIHIAHTLADTLTLAEISGIAVCIEIYFCWAEAGLPALFARAMKNCALVQLSDYVLGDRALPNRAVPGDGAIPLAEIISWLQDAGYRGVYDLELLGPRIDREGHRQAVTRAAGNVGEILTRLGY